MNATQRKGSLTTTAAKYPYKSSSNSSRCGGSNSSTRCNSDPGKMKISNLEDFDILKVLGKGAYGKVYQVQKLNGKDKSKIYAMKVVNKSRIMDSRTDMRHTQTERDVLVQVDHPFLIKLHYAFETSQRLYFVQEFCRGGELFRLMETERMFMEDQARFYLCEIICALDYLHSRNIVYRDLKTENIMLDEEGHIKLIDFGLSKIFDQNTTLTNTFCGTVEYMAPEVVMKSPGHGKPADWWSFGIFTFDLLTGRSPFHSNRGKKETKERILKGKFTIPVFISHDASDLIRRLLRRNVDRRLGSNEGAEEVRSHSFFNHVEWDMVEDRLYRPPHIPKLSRDQLDVSQFDPRFTSRTPRETVSDLEDPHEGLVVEEKKKPLSKMFADFDYVREDSHTNSGQLKNCDSGIGLEEDDDDEDDTDLDMDGLHIRGYGE